VHSRLLLAFIASCVAAWDAGAQVIRGRVVERESGAPVAGVLLTLVPESLGAVPPAAVLSADDGSFAILASGAGRYRLTAKRIGVRRFSSAVLELAAGETRYLTVELEPVAYTLPEVVVADLDLCVTRPGERGRVMALWDEARTALAAARVSLRDRLFEGQIRRYARGLDPRSLRVLEESWSEAQGVMDRPFTNLSGDSLSAIGFVRTVDGYTWFYAPDAEVLLSAAFLRDHCFSAVDGGRNRRGLTGLVFEPVPARLLPDVRGTLWLDARSFELSLVEFRFTGVPPSPGSDRAGGEMHFTRLPNGAWLTSQWFVRIPRQARQSAPVGAETRAPSVLIRPNVPHLIEEGGMVVSPRPRRGS
jgi:hypothetical protein